MTVNQVVTCGPENLRNSHHVKLTNASGTACLGFILCDTNALPSIRGIMRVPFLQNSLKTYQGEQKYSDLQPPFTHIGQNDWSGGRGLSEFEADSTRYNDGSRMDTTTANVMMMGPQECWSSGYRNLEQVAPYRYDFAGTKNDTPVYWSWQGLYDTHRYHAARFQASANETITTLAVWARPYGQPGGSLTIGICADNAGSINYSSIVASATVSSSAPGAALADEYKTSMFEVTVSASLTSGTYYWIFVKGENVGSDAPSAAHHWKVMLQTTAAASGYYSANSSTWVAVNQRPLFRATVVEKPFKAHFFNYKRGLHAALAFDDGSQTKVYCNGYQGSVTQVGTDSGYAFIQSNNIGSPADNSLIGHVVELTYGTGANAERPWRVVVSNVSAAGYTMIRVDTPFDVTPAAGTEFYVYGSDVWTEVTATSGSSHVPAGRVTDVLSVNNVTYLAMGDNELIKRMRRYNGGSGEFSTWATEWDSEQVNATFLEATQGYTSGSAVTTIWATQRGNPPYVYYGDSVWGLTTSASIADVNLGLAEQPVAGDYAEHATGTFSYGEPAVYWQFKEGSVYYWSSSHFEKLAIEEMKNVASERNGQTALAHGVYMYFPVGRSLLRYYRSNLDSVGPDRDEGLPADRRGYISSLCGYPGKIFAAVDAGPNGYSTILVYNLYGWHEIYRAPIKGRRIRSLFLQTTPGSMIDRLWFSMGSDMLWLPVDPNPREAIADENGKGFGYHFCPEGYIDTCWYSLSLANVEKYWQSVAMMFKSEYTTTAMTVDVYYRLDSVYATWTYAGQFSGSNIAYQKLELGSHDVDGMRIQFRFVFRTLSNQTTPLVSGTVLDAITRVPNKDAYSMTFRAADYDTDLLGSPEMTSGSSPIFAADKIAQLEEWAAGAVPIYMESMSTPFDGKWVMLEHASLRPLSIIKDASLSTSGSSAGREIQVLQMSAVDV